MNTRRKFILKTVESILEENNVFEPPVDVEKIAASRGLLVERKDVESISGFLVKSYGNAIIGVNSSNAPVRQRFTIAHELGHYLLHPSSAEDLHIDSNFEIKFRDDLSSQGTDAEEQEANFFAAELLMPRKFLYSDIANWEKFELEDHKFQESVDVLARKYGVSSQAMVFRLANLGQLNSKY